MTNPTAAGPSPRVPTTGAWIGAFVATWAALTVVWHVAWLVAVSVTPSICSKIADRADQEGGPAGPPAHFVRLCDLGFELARRLETHTTFAVGSAVVLGLALFVAGFALMRGSEAGRRGARVLLALKAAHSLAAAAWLVVLATTQLGDWRGRFASVVADFAREASVGSEAAAVADVSAAFDAAPFVFGGLVVTGVAVAAGLFLLCGRPSAREWCVARRA
jgi:hypothetical protein